MEIKEKKHGSTALYQWLVIIAFYHRPSHSLGK